MAAKRRRQSLSSSSSSTINSSISNNNQSNKSNLIISQSNKACTYCKLRKIKCNSSEQNPCANCIKAGKQCIPSNDKRSLRPSTNDLINLQDRVIHLESYIHSLTEKIDALNNNTSITSNNKYSINNLTNDLNTTPNTNTKDEEQTITQKHKYPKPKVFNRINNNTDNEIYGPTSIFNLDSLSPNSMKRGRGSRNSSKNNSKNNSPSDIKSYNPNDNDDNNDNNSNNNENENNSNNNDNDNNNIENDKDKETDNTNNNNDNDNNNIIEDNSSNGQDKYSPINLQQHSSPIFSILPKERRESVLLPVIIPLKTLNKDITIIKYIKSFFQWLYPDIHMFIPRETFLIDFYHPRTNKKQSYCSIELVYSICAIGSLLSDENLKTSNDNSNTLITNENISENYYNAAKHLLFQNIDNPSITTLQSFLLLGLYDMYRGKNNSCWLLSGIGLRIGFDIGFHLSPNLNSNTKKSINKLSLLFKSRIYWGCFIVDHFIGMILGRPSVLQINDSTIGESDRVPDLDWIKDFNFKENEIIDVSNPLKSIIRLIVLTERNTREIFYFEKEISKKFKKLINFNKEIKDWRNNLIPDLKWDNINSLKDKSVKPPDMIHIYYYYIVLLCINRPFLDINKLINNNKKYKNNLYVIEMIEQNEILEYQNIVYGEILECIKELGIAIGGFVSQYGYKRCSILIIYSSIIIVSVIIIINEKKKNNDNEDNVDGDKDIIAIDIQNHELYGYLIDNLKLLKESGKVWGLAKERFKMFEKKLKEDFNINFDNEYDKMYKRRVDIFNESRDVNNVQLDEDHQQNYEQNYEQQQYQQAQQQYQQQYYQQQQQQQQYQQQEIQQYQQLNSNHNNNNNDSAGLFGWDLISHLGHVNFEEVFGLEMSSGGVNEFGTEWTEWMGLVDIDVAGAGAEDNFGTGHVL